MNSLHEADSEPKSSNKNQLRSISIATVGPFFASEDFRILRSYTMQHFNLAGADSVVMIR